jgi:hypothetical protein
VPGSYQDRKANSRLKWSVGSVQQPGPSRPYLLDRAIQSQMKTVVVRFACFNISRCTPTTIIVKLFGVELWTLQPSALFCPKSRKLKTRGVLQTHAPHFCNEIQHSAQLPLYQALGRAVSAFIKMEAEQDLA